MCSPRVGFTSKGLVPQVAQGRKTHGLKLDSVYVVFQIFMKFEQTFFLTTSKLLGRHELVFVSFLLPFDIGPFWMVPK